MAFVVVSLTYQTNKKNNNLKLRAMNAFTFTNNQKATFGNKLNIITSTSKGFCLETINDRMITIEITDGKVKFYKSVEALKSKSKQYKRNESFVTIMVEPKGTDMANAIVTKL